MTRPARRGGIGPCALSIFATLSILGGGCDRANGPGSTVAIRQPDEDAIRRLLAEFREHLQKAGWSSVLADHLDCEARNGLLAHGWKAVPYVIEQVALQESVDAYIGSALIGDEQVTTPKQVYEHNLERKRDVGRRTLGPHVLATLLQELPCGKEAPSLERPESMTAAAALSHYNSAFAWLEWWQTHKGRFTFRTTRPPVIDPPKDRHSLVPQVAAVCDNGLLTVYAVGSSIERIIERGGGAMGRTVVIPRHEESQVVHPLRTITTVRLKGVTPDEFLYKMGTMVWGLPYDKMDDKLRFE